VEININHCRKKLANEEINFDPKAKIYFTFFGRSDDNRQNKKRQRYLWSGAPTVNINSSIFCDPIFEINRDIFRGMGGKTYSQVK